MQSNIKFLKLISENNKFLIKFKLPKLNSLISKAVFIKVKTLKIYIIILESN